MPADEQLAWGLVMDYISGPLDWRRGNIFDARAASLQCVSTDGMTVEDFMMFREPQPTLSNIEEFQKRGEQMETLRAFLAASRGGHYAQSESTAVVPPAGHQMRNSVTNDCPETIQGNSGRRAYAAGEENA